MLIPEITLILMVVFAVVTAGIGRREGNGIFRRPYDQRYTDAPGARTGR